jgi:predicted ATPase/DNA-binding winged helix-turn-helix (wHTH) protein
MAERLLERADEPLELGSRALDILITLVERAGEVVTRKELISRVWPDVIVEEANLRVHIAGLRKALGDGRDGARYVTNVTGRGYCFVAPVTRSASQRSAPQARSLVSDRLRQLPARLMRMVGRDVTVRALSAQLMTRRFVSIVGPGGMGKTTVAVSIAHALINYFEGAVFFVDLGALTDPGLVPTAVASALGIMMQAAQDPFLSLLAFLGDRRVLLVLDNCEHVIDAAAALAEPVVSGAPQAHILATSREALRVEGEHVHLLYPLDGPLNDVGLTAAEALTFPAVQLFMERAAASGHRSELSDADAPIVAGICRRLDGIALAIELAASRVSSHGIRGTAELLDNRFKLLWQGRRTALPRHQTLNAMLDWSYNLLLERDKLVLCRLSVFVGVFTLKAALSVAGTETNDPEVADAVANLVAKSLISPTTIGESTYYRLLDTTQAYAAGKLTDHGEADNAARRHAIYYSSYLGHDEAIQSTFGAHDLSGYAPHIGNVRAALEWTFSDHGDIAVGVELATWAAPLFVGLSLLDECRNWCERALASLDDAGRGTRREMILQEALALSSMFTKGNGDGVRAAIERGIALAETFEDRDHQLQLLAGLNIFLQRIGDFRGALTVAEQGVAVARVAKNMAGLVMTDWMLGVSQHLVGNQAAAQRHCEDGMANAVELGQLNTNFFGYNHRIRALVALARALWLRGFSEQALRTAQQAIDEAERRDHPVSVCISLIYAAPVFLWRGDLERAADFIERLIAYAGRYSLAPYRAVGMALKGELAVTRDQAGSGLILLRDALETLHAEQHNILATVFTSALAEGLWKTGQFDEALITINGAAARAASRGATFDMAELLRIKGQILAAMPRPDWASAADCLMKSLAVAREQSALAWELRSATALARLLSENGQRDQARDTLAPVYDRFIEGFETADLRIARQLIHDLA